MSDPNPNPSATDPSYPTDLPAGILRTTTITFSGTDDAPMPPPAKLLSLTLILAATPSLGIGKSGGLPWPQLRKEMGYFRRVTMRVPPLPSSHAGESGVSGKGARRCNAVVMGRKTWDSIPERFRPLEGRVNVVVTRSPEAFAAQIPPSEGDEGGVEGPFVVGSVGEALEQLQLWNKADEDVKVDRVFVIGGATIYDAALKLPQTDRVLLTRIEREYECDTHFSVDLNKDQAWEKSGKEELEGFVGEEVDVVEEKGVKFEFGMYEKVKGGEGR